MFKKLIKTTLFIFSLLLSATTINATSEPIIEAQLETVDYGDKFISSDRYEISHKTIDCDIFMVTHEVKGKCKQIRKTNTDEWQTYSDDIVGLNYNEGTSYILTLDTYERNRHYAPSDISLIYLKVSDADNIITSEHIEPISTADTLLDVSQYDINTKMVNCTRTLGGMNVDGKCYQYKKSNSEEWITSTESIQGFDYKENRQYKVNLSLYERSKYNQVHDVSNLYLKLEKIISISLEYSTLEKLDRKKNTLYVAATRATCYIGNSKRKCLQIKSHENSAYRLLYRNIQGFHYQEGNEYILKVKKKKYRTKVKKMKNGYRLREIYSKLPIN